MRSLLALDKAALNLDRVQISYLIAFDFRLRNEIDGRPTIEAPVYFTTDAHTRVYNGIEWLGAGALLDMSLPQEDSSLQAHACEISMNGLDPTIISLALNEYIEGTDVQIWMLLLEPDSNQPVSPAWLYHRGTVSEVQITPPAQAGILEQVSGAG